MGLDFARVWVCDRKRGWDVGTGVDQEYAQDSSGECLVKLTKGVIARNNGVDDCSC